MNVACTQCGTPSPPGNRFCGHCGTPLPPSPGNLPSTARPSYATPDPGMPASLTPCWQCGRAVDPLHQATCTSCGANVAMAPPQMPGPPQMPAAVGGPPPSVPPYLTSEPAPSAGFGPPTAGLGPPPPYAVAEPAPAPRTRRRERVLSGAVLTVVVAIVIVLLLAVLGIIAGQMLGA